MFKKYGVSAIITAVLGAAYYYFALPVLHIKSASLWGFILFLIICYAVLVGIFAGGQFLSRLVKHYKPITDTGAFFINPKKFSTKKAKIIILSVAAVLVIVLGFIFVSSSQFFNASKYQKMLNVTESNFNEDIVNESTELEGTDEQIDDQGAFGDFTYVK